MAKSKPKSKFYKWKDDNDVLVQGIVSEISISNKEYPIKGTIATRCKNVFSVDTIPETKDKRFKNCISWERQTIDKGDLISFKGYLIPNGFIVKGLSILRKSTNEAKLRQASQVEQSERKGV